MNFDSPQLDLADCIPITFEMQKKDDKNNTITQHATGDMTMCPVKMAAALVRQVQSYPGTDDNTPICTVWSRSVTTTVTSRQVINALKDAVSSIGEKVLNIEVSEIGTHSL